MRKLTTLLSLLFVFVIKTAFGGMTPTAKLNDKDVFGTRYFIENKGQYDAMLDAKYDIKFVLDNGLEKIFFTTKGLVYELTHPLTLTEKQRKDLEKGLHKELKQADVEVLEMNWQNANSQLSIEKHERSAHYFTYGLSRYNAFGFKTILYKNVYPNIDIEYTIPKDKTHGIKYNVILHPGAHPEDIKIAYTGDVLGIKKDKEGNMIIQTKKDQVIEYAPKSAYETGGGVASEFNLKNDLIGFTFPNGYSSSKKLIIDPFVTTISSLSTNNYAFDVDYDFSGNIYIYGGYNPFKVARYNAAGVLQWTFAGTVTTPAWSSAPILSQASNFAVNKFNSKTYIGQGYVGSGNLVIRLDASGNYDNFINAANNQFQEVWDIGFHCITADVFVLGGGVSSNISAVTINPTTAVIALSTFQPTNTNIAQDVVSHAIDDAGNIFVIYAGGSLNDDMCAVNATFNGNLWTQPSTFTVFTEQGNKNQYQGTPSLSSNGFNALAVNANFLFYYDGSHLAAYNKTSGALVGSTTISSLTIKRQGGIAVDDCNTVYIGGDGSILSYNFNGTAFTATTSIPLSVNTTNQYVYDIKLDKQNKLLYVAGSGFVGTYSPVNTLACPTASSACFFSLSQDFQICAGATATITGINSTSLTGVSYSMQPGSLTNGSGVFTVSPLATTVYTVFITGTNQSNVVVTNSAVSTVSVFPQPLVVPTLTQTSCTSTLNAFNLNLLFNPPSPVPGYTITWTPVPAGVLTNTQTSAVGGIAPGPYNAFITTAWGCTVSANFTMNPLPEPANFTISPNPPYVINCTNPQLDLTYLPATLNYTTNNNIYTPIIGPNASFTGSVSSGIWTVTASHPVSGCVSTQTFVINSFAALPSSTISPLTQNITCSVTSIVPVVAIGSPSVSVSHQWISPSGGTLSIPGATSSFVPGGPGVYTHCITNDISGCSTCKNFTVTSSDGFPTYSVSSPQNFTLGCTTKSVATINIVNAQTTPTPGGAVSYTVLGPPTSLSYVTGTLTTYTVAVPGTWTVITKDNSNSCETKVQISIIQNTFAPNISAIVPQQILSCYVPSVVLEGQSTTPNVNYNWSFPGTPGNISGSTITVNTNQVNTTTTLIANYSLTITDNSSTCKSSTVIPMNQNLFKPNAVIASSQNSLTCLTETITLTNISSTSIPPLIYPNGNPVVAELWQGPTPQEPLQLSSTYIGALPGTYTMIVKDLNNGCTSVATKTIDDFRDYPYVNRPNGTASFTLDCGMSELPIYATVDPPASAMNYSWIAPPSMATSTKDKPSLIVNEAGLYQVIVTNTLNGCASLGVVTVANGKLNGDFTSDKVKGYAPLEVLFTNNSSSTDTLSGKDDITSVWNFGNGISTIAYSSTVQPKAMYTQSGTYSVTMYVVKGACMDTVVKSIEVELPSRLIVPNIFTPNGDGSNDLFFLTANNQQEISMKIVDRWGKTVFEVTSTSGNIEWDGSNQQGKECAEGVYSYVLKTKGKDGVEQDLNGTITLIR